MSTSRPFAALQHELVEEILKLPEEDFHLVTNATIQQWQENMLNQLYMALSDVLSARQAQKVHTALVVRLRMMMPDLSD